MFYGNPKDAPPAIFEPRQRDPELTGPGHRPGVRRIEGAGQPDDPVGLAGLSRSARGSTLTLSDSSFR